MEFTAPNSSGYTVYGKTGCSYCEKAKALLTEYEQEFIYVNCDEYLLTDRDAFLEFIQGLAKQEYRTFPMIFSDATFIRGYTDTIRQFMLTGTGLDK